jgi:hypothetical protein
MLLGMIEPFQYRPAVADVNGKMLQRTNNIALTLQIDRYDLFLVLYLENKTNCIRLFFMLQCVKS